METLKHIKAGNGVEFAYRVSGEQSQGVPLVMHMHFRGHMNLWDPALIRPLAKARPVILFDQAGTGGSSGTIPPTYQGWADDTMAFVDALGLQQIDLFGFSMGGRAAQMAALTRPRQIRKLVLGGTDPSAPSATQQTWPRPEPPAEPGAALRTAATAEEGRAAVALSLFPATTGGQAAAEAYFDRIQNDSISGSKSPNLDLLDVQGATQQQMVPLVDWMRANDKNSFSRLGELAMPVLVLDGDDDLLIPTPRSWEILSGIPDAQLIIYPKAGHGFLWQCAALVAKHINLFLDGNEEAV